MQHLVDTDQFTIAQIEQVIRDAKRFKSGRTPLLLRDKVLVTLFFESSTRTRSSFEIAAKRLGAATVHLDPTKSSTQKGESLEDTFTNLCAMEPDGVIIRHSANTTPQMLADMDITPVINAGAGNYAHPTQSLLDYYTMLEYFDGSLEGKTLAIVGDIVSSRAPEQFMPDIDLPKYERLDDVMDSIDVIMSLRAQLERHAVPHFDDYDEYAKHYCITQERMGDRDILLLHPGPVMRNVDISDQMLDDPRCRVLEQVKNGVYIRMAILKLLLLDS